MGDKFENNYCPKHSNKFCLYQSILKMADLKKEKTKNPEQFINQVLYNFTRLYLWLEKEKQQMNYLI